MNIQKLLPNEAKTILPKKGFGTNFSHEYRNYSELIPNSLLHANPVNKAGEEYGRLRHLPNVILEKQPSNDNFVFESTIM